APPVIGPATSGRTRGLAMTKQNPFSRRDPRPSYARMIPKSGYRFSDKIMRKRRKPFRRAASRHARAGGGTGFGSIMLGASYSFSLRWVSLHSTHPANYKQQIKKEAERRQAHVFRWSAPQTSLRSLRKPSASGAARASQTSVRSLRTQNPRG